MILYLLGCSHLLPTLVSPGVAVPCRSLSERVDSARPIRDVSALASSPRRSEARKEEVRALLEEQLTAAGLSVERRPFEISGIRGVNLVASGPDGGRILVGAHYDTVGSSPGADDNASGVAVLLEVARVLGPSVPVTYVLFDAEEPHEASVGRDDRNFAFGSQAFVDATTADRWDLALVIESVGYSCDTPGCQAIPSGVPESFPRDGRAIYWAVNRSDRDWGSDLATYRLASEDHPSYAVSFPGQGLGARQSRFSDHTPFWDIGVDAILLTDTALLRNPNYHRMTDTPETLDASMLADAARGTVAAVGAAAGRCPGGVAP